MNPQLICLFFPLWLSILICCTADRNHRNVSIKRFQPRIQLLADVEAPTDNECQSIFLSITIGVIGGAIAYGIFRAVKCKCRKSSIVETELHKDGDPFLTMRFFDHLFDNLVTPVPVFIQSPITVPQNEDQNEIWPDKYFWQQKPWLHSPVRIAFRKSELDTTTMSHMKASMDEEVLSQDHPVRFSDSIYNYVGSLVNVSDD